MKDRLIELLEEADKKYDSYLTQFIKTAIDDIDGKSAEEIEELAETMTQHTEIYADHLLANGVIVPPCKVWFDKIGDDVYVIDDGEVLEGILCTIGLASPTESYVLIIYDRGFEDEHCFEFEFSDFGKIVFLTREEAEQALKEREQK